MNEYIQRTAAIYILPKGEPIYSETSTKLEIVDDAGGEFLKIEQQSDSLKAQNQTVLITPEEWPAIRSAADELMREIKKHDTK